MPKRIIPLTDIKVRNAKPKDGAYNLFDGSDLFLLVIQWGQTAVLISMPEL